MRVRTGPGSIIAELKRSPQCSLVDPGKKAPAFALKDQHGDTHRLSAYAGKPVVLYFYPKDDTPGCTTETCAFRDNLPRFKASKAVVLGVSILDEASKARFAEKFDVTFPLLADATHDVAERYGVWQEKSNYGRRYIGIVRTTFLIGPDGKVAKRWDKVKVDGHAEAGTGGRRGSLTRACFRAFVASCRSTL